MNRTASAARPPFSAACPDCPGARMGLLRSMIGETKFTCMFETVSVEGRAFTPTSWADRHAFGLVRRGVLIRQRLDETGSATAIDAAGPGCYFPLNADRASASCGYAATDLIVCLCPRAVLRRALAESGSANQDLMQLQLDALARVERLAQARGGKTVHRRVASLLRVLSETLSPPRTRDRLPSGLQQRDMAKLLGVRHETLCRVLRALEEDGAIERSPDGILLVDRSKL